MRKVELNKTKDREYRVLCPECGVETRHIVVQSVDVRGREDYSEDFSIDWECKHQTIECQGCLTISYRDESSNSEAWDPASGELDATVRLYPVRDKDALHVKVILNTPRTLRQIYREVLDCFNNEIYTLCAVGLRALIEGICDSLGVKDGPVEVDGKAGTKKIIRMKTLKGKLAGLYEREILTRCQVDILHQHRYMGNEAVHQLTMPSKEELELAIPIVEHTLESVFEIPQKALELHKQRLKKDHKGMGS